MECTASSWSLISESTGINFPRFYGGTSSARPTRPILLLPVLTKRSQRFTGDLDEEIRASERDVETLVAALGDLPGTVTGAIGDADPRLAVEDTLRTFPADEVITIPPPTDELDAFKLSGPNEVFKGVRLPVTVIEDS
jgi:hypothetical protein